MYVLCKIDRNSNHSGSIFYHPLIPVFQSEDMTDITNEITKRVLDGCPAKNLCVFETVHFEVKCGVTYTGIQFATKEE